MKLYNLPPLIEKMFERIGLIYEAYQHCANYSSNPYIQKSLREEGLKQIPFYRDLLIYEVEIIKHILLEHMVEREEE